MSTDTRPRILWIHPGGLWPIAGGGAARTWALIAYLREQGFAVELVTGNQGAHNDELEARVDRLWIRPSDPPRARHRTLQGRLRAWAKASYQAWDPERRLARHIAGRVRGIPALETNPLRRNRRPELERYAGRVAYQHPPLAAIASYAWIAPALDHIPPGTLRILDTIDIQHKRHEAAAAAGGNLSHVVCTRDEEQRALNRADILLAIQSQEAAILEAMCPDRSVVLAEHAHDLATYQPSPAASREILYVGNRYDPNVLGLRTILDEVWPLVRRDCPDARLTVCGRVCETVRRAAAGVTLAGPVADLSPYYARAAAVLNPVPYGTGLKIKTVEALAQGRAVVCTTAGAGGLGDPDKLPLILAEKGDSMAQAVVHLLRSVDARHRLEAEAADFAQIRFAPSRVYGPLLAELRRHAGMARV